MEIAITLQETNMITITIATIATAEAAMRNLRASAIPIRAIQIRMNILLMSQT